MLSVLPEEMEQVIKETKTDTAPRSDGLPMAFFKKFWVQTKELTIKIINGFALGTVDITRLNFGILPLISSAPINCTDQNVLFKFGKILHRSR